MKKLMVTVFFLALCPLLLTGCGNQDEDEVVLRIANSEEYIDEGGWDEDEKIELEDSTSILGENSLIDDFEVWYEKTYGQKVRIEYSTYGTNEELYNQMTLGNVFDLVCPSEYMIMKLMDEGRVQPYSDDFYKKDKENNYYAQGVSPYIEQVFQNLKQNDESIQKYAAGYMWGTMGLVYNPEQVDEEDVKHWSMLLNKKYNKKITMKDGVRDSYLVALCILHEKDALPSKNILETWLNDTSAATVNKVEDILSKMRENAYSLEVDSGKADMVTGKVVANMQWSGDAAYSMDQAEEDGVILNYSVPDECSNIWFDGWSMMKNGISEDARKQQVAEAFVNFVSHPDNVIRNMYYIGYSSVIAGGDSNLIYDYLDYCYGADEDEEDTVDYSLDYFFGKSGEKSHVLRTTKEQQKRQLYALYPPEDVLKRCAVMKCFDEKATERISQMWINIRCFTGF